ncbi:MAG: response regulator transcription factor [Gammaproteobacteria bacterium]|nr:response regulator transcription factor [Phycisphaerae bacterium]NIR93310.1 response regulator transcription factor [Gammaproteobacteria bacterium]NIW43586.1 response regulator [Gammaproteobacteria bacterium]
MDNILKGKTIVAIDDELETRKLLDIIFRRTGATVLTGANYEAGMALLETENPDVMLVDIMMPQIDGLSMCQRVRQVSDVPIIIVTARDRPKDIVTGLRAGADDYVVKPFQTEILVERVKAVLRRNSRSHQPFWEETIEDNYLHINLMDRIVMVEGRPVKLSNTEFDLLAFLIKNANQTCSFEHIMKYVWGQERTHHPEYIHVYIWRLRKKIERNPKDPSYIITDHSRGYRFIFRPV